MNSNVDKYKEYLKGHIGNVQKALEILVTLNIPFVNDNIDTLREIVKNHDASKYEEPEWSAYLHHFYPENDDESKMGEEFDVAVQHHIKNNKHHWNYWCNDDNQLIDDIDEEDYKLHTIERICDWLAMAGQNNEGPNDYYQLNKEFVVQPDYARELCDEIFPLVPEDFSKDMWHGNRGELDEGQSLISLIGNGKGDPKERKKGWFILDMKTRYPSWRGGRDTYYFCFNKGYDETISYSKKLYEYIEEGYKYLIEYTPCNIPWKSRTAGVIVSMRNLKVLDKVPITPVNEDLYMSRKIVNSLGKRVKKSKTSNTIEIDTQMTNHDKQLKEDIDISGLLFTGKDIQNFISKTEENMKKTTYSEYTEFVDVDLLDSIKEYDRVGKNSVYPQDKFEELFYTVLQNGITDPGYIDYCPYTGRVFLGEGNHRLAICKILGVDKMPVYCVRSERNDSTGKIIDKDKITPYCFGAFGEPRYADPMKPRYLGNGFGPDYDGVHTIEQLEKMNESALLEMRLDQIKQKSRNQDPERINRSRKVKTTYIGMSKFGILNFKTTSQTRTGYHYQTLEFKDMGYFQDIIKSGNKIMPDDIKKALKEQDVNIFCTDESFTYWAWAHQAYKYDFLYIDDRIPDLKKRIQAPKINNVRLNGGACKHILSVIDYVMRPFVLLAISDDMNKYLGQETTKADVQSDETKNRTDSPVQDWSMEDIEEYLGLSMEQILADISKTLQIAPIADRGEIIQDIVDEVIPNEDLGLRRQIVDKIEDELEGDNNASEQ